MNYDFNTELLKSDLKATKDFFLGFIKSFGLAPRSIGFFEEMKIRFMLTLVEMGPVKIFKTIVVIVGGLILYFKVFRYADSLFMTVIIIAFIMFYAWVWKPELAKEAKEGTAGLDQYFATISGGVQGIFKTEEKKK